MQRLYLAPLDGLRFIAFLAVFVHHLPQFGESETLVAANVYGWAGVELFFLISSFLFFHLFNAEFVKTGTIDAVKFYIRRLLRIYPLMILFPASMLLVYGSEDGMGAYRLMGLALFADNFITWFGGYNGSIPNSAHLWTLSFEFQVYLLIPFAFMAYRKLGKRAFLGSLAAIFTYCFMVRSAFFGAGAAHPIVWVTPFLRPETILLGIALFVVRPTWHWGYSAMTALLTGYLFLSVPPPWMTPISSAASYPLVALMCAGVVDTGLRMPAFANILSFAPMRYLGQISFGLYVFHKLGMSLAGSSLYVVGFDPEANIADYFTLLFASLVVTISLATVSYFTIERWLSRIKHRYEIVESRPALA